MNPARAIAICFWLLVTGWAAAQPATKKWEFNVGSGFFSSPAIAGDGTILFGANDGKVYALSPGGIKQWEFSTLGGQITMSVSADGILYIGSDKLYALNLNGSKLWEFDAEVLVFGMPVVAPDGTIYSTGFDGRLYALRPDGTLRWSTPSFGADPVLAEDGAAIVPTGFGGIAAVNPDGIIRWAPQIGSIIYASAALAQDGTILVGSSSPDFGARLWALDSTGRTNWAFAAPGQIIGAPAVGPDGSIFFVSDAGRVFAVYPNGTQRWEYTLASSESGTTPATPAVASDGTVYFTALDGGLRALNQDGQLKWQFDAGARVVVSPVIGADGTIYFGADNGKFFAVEGDGGPPAAGQWPLFRRDARHSASRAQLPIVPPPVPANPSASLGEFTDKVVIRWESARGAREYEVWRGPSTNSVDAVRIASEVSGKVQFDDVTGISGQTYYYFVKARNSAGTSFFSAPAEGLRRVAVDGEVIWSFQTGGGIGSAPALDSEGNVLFGSTDGNFYALAADGAKKWQFQTEGAVFGAPAIAENGTIYFGSGVRHPSGTWFPSGKIYALKGDGTKLWEYATDQPVSSTPALGADGTVFIGVGDVAINNIFLGGSLLALTPDGTKRWQLTTGDEFSASPAVAADGTLYAGARNGPLYALAPDGRQLWAYSPGSLFLAPPAIGADGTLYFSSGERFFALNPDGIERWRFAMQNGGATQAAVGSDGTIYFGSADNNVYSLRPDGTKKWEFRAGNSPLTTPALSSDGTLYVGGLDRNLYALHPDGTRKWVFATEGYVGASPVISPTGVVYFGSTDGRLYAVRGSGPPVESPWPMFQHDARHTAKATVVPAVPVVPQGVSATDRTRVTDVRVTWGSVMGASSYEVWRSALADSSAAERIAMSVSGQTLFEDRSAVPETTYYYWVKARSPGGVSDFSASDSGIRRQPVPGDLLYEWPLDGIIHASPAIGLDGTIYVGVQTGTQSLLESSLYALNADGTIKWSRSRSVWIYGSPAIGPDGTIYYGAYHRNFIALNPDGAVKWEFQPEAAVIAAPAIGTAAEVYFGSLDGKLYAFNPDGTLRWSFAAAAGVVSSPALGGEAVYFVAGNVLYALNENGSERWRTTIGTGITVWPIYSSPVLGGDGTLYVGSDTSGLMALNTDGTRRWTYSAAGGVIASPVLDAAGNILIGGSGFFSVSPAGGSNWNYPGGTVWGTAAVGLNGLIYVGTREGSFLALDSTGNKVWETVIGAPISSSPAIGVDGTIYVGADDGKLRAFYSGTALANTPWPMYQRDLRHTGRTELTAFPPGTPATVAASDEEFNDRVRVSWPSVMGAFFYEVWRNSTADLNSAARIASNVTASVSFDDKGVDAGVTYYYWVRAGNTLGRGAFAGPDTGVRRIAVPGEKVGEAAVSFNPSSAPALGKDGTIYFGGTDRRFHALYPDLTKKWDYPSTGSGIGGFFTEFSEPAIAENGVIYFGAPDGRYYALAPNGSKQWDFSASVSANAPAVGRDGSIYVTGGNKLFALDALGAKRWEYTTTALIAVAPVVETDGTVYVGSDDRMLHAVHPDGTLKWKFNAQSAIRVTPAIGPDGTIFFLTQARRLFAVTPEGAQRWSFLAGGDLFAAPVIGPDCTIYFGSRDRKLYAIDYDGSKKWDFLTGGEIRGTAVVGADGTIFVGALDRKLYALTAAGSNVWNLIPHEGSAAGAFSSALTITEDGRLLAGAGDGYLYAVKAGSSLAVAPWPVFHQNAQYRGRAESQLRFTGGLQMVRASAGTDVFFDPEFLVPGRRLAEAVLVVGTNVITASTNPPFQLIWTNVAVGTYEVRLRGRDELGCQYRSVPLTLVVSEGAVLSVRLGDGFSPAVQFDAVLGQQYVMEYSSDLVDWKASNPVLTTTNSPVVWIDDGPPRTESPPSSVPRRFYRVLRINNP